MEIDFILKSSLVLVRIESYYYSGFIKKSHNIKVGKKISSQQLILPTDEWRNITHFALKSTLYGTKISMVPAA